MASLSNKIKQYVNAEVDFTSDVMLQDDSNGKGAYIKEWNLAIAKPTDSTISMLLNHKQPLIENNQRIKATRKALYGSWESQLEEIYDNGIDSWKARIAQIKKQITQRKLNNEQTRSRCNRTTIRNHVNYWCEWGFC
jgi:hypothetical protein